MKKILLVLGALLGVVMLAEASGGGAGFGADVDYRGNDDLPRGMRNNNPGNIKYNSANNWQGQDGSDGFFCIFVNYAYGIRAMMKLLMNYHKQGFRTISAIVNKYAPAHTVEENPTDNYIDFVADMMGVSPNSPLSYSYNNFANLVIAMAAYENGREDAVTPDQTEQVWAEFFQGVGGLRGSDHTGQRSYLSV